MSLRNYDNSNSPRFLSVINDGNTIQNVTVSGDRVVVLGFAKTEKDTDGNPIVPTQELYPSTSGTVSIADLIEDTKNVSDDAVPVKYPSEISIALEELQTAGVENVQVIVIGEDSRLRDVTARMARERFIALESAYDLIDDLPIDQLMPVNVTMGLKGDGLYNAASYEVVYDPDAASGAAANLLELSDVTGFLTVEDSDHEKDTVAEAEDLAYQLANICFVIGSNGTPCTGIVRTVSPLEVKYLQELDVVTPAQAGTTFGASGTESTRTAANSWALYSSSYFAAWDFPTTHVAVNGDDVLAHIESAAYVADKATNAAVTWANATTSTIKPSVTSLARPATFLTEASSATVPSSQELDIVTWALLFGTATPSEMKSWAKFLKGFGNGTDGVFKNGVASYLAWDGVTADAQGQAQYYRYYKTEDSEMPTSSTDADVVVDRNGRPQDIGKLLDVVAANSRYSGPSVVLLDPANGVNKSMINAGLGDYLGKYNLLPSSIAHTRQIVTTVEPLAFLSSRSISDLTRLRYVCYKEEDGAYLINRDITGGLYISDAVRTDFVNRLTYRIVKDAIDVARIEGKPLLGTVGNPVAIEGYKQSLEQEYARWANPEDGRLTRLPTVDVRSDIKGGIVGSILVLLGLPVAGEILEIEAVATVLQ